MKVALPSLSKSKNFLSLGHESQFSHLQNGQETLWWLSNDAVAQPCLLPLAGLPKAPLITPSSTAVSILARDLRKTD